MEEKNQNKLAGLVYIIFGTIFFWNSLMLDMGTWRDLGPGRWPLICSIILIIVGLFMMVRRR